jgi:flagellar assembly protein FliH
MTSKLLKKPTAELELVIWPRPRGAGGGSFVPRHERGAGGGDTSQLRAKLETLTANLEAQTKAEYSKGFQAGQSAARKEVEDQLTAALAKLASTVAEIAAARNETIRRAEADTVHLAVEVARRILHREVSLDPTALEALIRAALDKLQGQEIYRVRVHPDLAQTMRRCLEQTGRHQAVEVVADSVQPQGGAVFEISRGNLDASVDTQLREIERGLTDLLEARL